MNTAYAHKHGKLVHVSTVVSGLKCGCYCTKCNNPVIARKGQIREYHFAHTSSTECAGAAETVLHLLSKQIISELSSILIPAYNWKSTKKLPNYEPIVHEARVAKGGWIPIEAVEIEKRLGSVKPDIVIVSQGKKLIVEIAVTHTVDRLKKRKLRKNNIPAIEICLPKEYALKERDELETIIKNNTEIKHWLYHPKEKQAILTLKEKWNSVKDRFRRPKYNDSSRFVDSAAVSSKQYKRQFQRKNGLSQYEHNRRVESFYKKYGRYPTYEEVIEDPELHEFRR